MRLVDSHCHLDDEQFSGDREQVIERARAAGVGTLVVIGSEGAVRLAEQYPFIFATAGIHPHDAAKADLERIRDLLHRPRVLAAGEIGLDYHYDFSPRDVQRAVFAKQLGLAAEARKPIVIHTREAWDDTLRILREHGLPHGGIMHCFTGGPEQASEALALGFHISFGGVLTFPKARMVRDAAALVPEDRLLVETDAPYLAPVPYRGRRNEPAFVLETARKLAEIRGVAPEHIAAVTAANFDQLCLQ